MMKKARLYRLLSAALVPPLVAVLSGSSIALAQDADRAISISTTYTSIVMASNQTATLPITLTNHGQADEQVDIGIASVPEGWVAELVNEESDTAYHIRSLYLLADGGSQTVYFRARPPAGVSPGDYSFVIEATTEDGVVNASLDMAIGIQDRPRAVGRAKLTTTYPELRSQGSSSFEFKVSLTNEGSEDRVFNFSAEAPPGWEVSFRPGFQQKQIAAMGIKAGDSADITVELSPPKYVQPGRYTVTMRAASGTVEASIDLTAVVLEKEKELTYDLELLTADGRLNADAYAGHETRLSLLLTNRGSAEQQNVSLYSSKPDGWEVTFEPDRIDTLLPGQTMEVRATIIPPSKTIAGDYSVALRTSGRQASDRVEIRVTVGSSTVWGWAGLAIVLAVIAGTGVLFWRLGRR
jgi:uncharacterized membrane protein